MSKILDRTGTGAALTAAQNDSNLSSLSGINEAQTGTTYTVTIDDQNRTIEFSNAGAVTVTMTAIATIAAALHTDDFKVILLNIGGGTVTVNTADTFLGGGTSLTLLLFEYVELQTNSTLGIWNILNSGKNLLGITSSVAELNILDGVTSSTAELNILDGVTSTAAELNILDGVTSTAAEINIIDGDTAATATTIVDADRVILNDAGVMKQVAVTDVDTYISATTKTLTNKTLTSPVLNGTLSGTAIGRDALVYNSANTSIPNTTMTALPFDSEDHDTDSIHDTVINNSRLTVPAGVTKIRLSTKVEFLTNSTGSREVSVRKNNLITYTGWMYSTQVNSNGRPDS
jgi:hypothetical protein